METVTPPSLQYSRQIGPTLCGGMVLMAANAFVSFLIVVTALSSNDSWWVACDSVPCDSPAAPAKSANDDTCTAKGDDVETLNSLLPVPPVDPCLNVQPEDCPHATCKYYLDVLQDQDSDAEAEVLLDYACLAQFRLRTNSYVSFGALCCSVCGNGGKGDLETVFRDWSSDKQTCGLFHCRLEHSPQDDFCPSRASHAKAAQAFTVLTCIFLGFLWVFHATELADVLKKNRSRRMPLPRDVELTRQFIRRHAHVVHYICGLFAFLAGVLLVTTISMRLCEEKLSRFVVSGYGIRTMWCVMALQSVCGSYYYFTVRGLCGLSKKFKPDPTGAPVGSPQDLGQQQQQQAAAAATRSPNPIQDIILDGAEAGGADDVASGGDSDPPLQLHAVRMSPRENALADSGDEELAEVDIGRDSATPTPAQPPQPPQPEQEAQHPPPSLS
ncbi:hypothetical protein DIPPA_33067 [Diplonema papillatum]|nr:hypothetical protein DIPPA_33067 [Diplonema papillatum]